MSLCSLEDNPPALRPPWARSNSTRRREPIQNLEKKKKVLSMQNPRQEGPLSVLRKRNFFFFSFFPFPSCRLSSDPRAYIYQSVLRTVYDYSSHPSLYPSTLPYPAHITCHNPPTHCCLQGCLPPYGHHAALYGAIRPNSCTLPDNRASDREMRLPGSENPGNCLGCGNKRRARQPPLVDPPTADVLSRSRHPPLSPLFFVSSCHQDLSHLTSTNVPNKIVLPSRALPP